MKNDFISKISICFGLFSLAAASTSCAPDGSSVASGFTYKITTTTATYDLDLAIGLNLNESADIPIGDLGRFSFAPAVTGSGIHLSASLDYAALKQSSLDGMTSGRLLPNGQLMSSYVQEDLLRMALPLKNGLKLDAYVGPEAGQHYLGFAIEIPFIGREFPLGLTVSQRLLDPKGRPIGVATIYGPGNAADGSLIPGGVFFVSNLSQLYTIAAQDLGHVSHLGARDDFSDVVWEKQSKIYASDIEINHPGLQRNPQRLFKMMKRVEALGKSHPLDSRP